MYDKNSLAAAFASCSSKPLPSALGLRITVTPGCLVSVSGKATYASVVTPPIVVAGT
jgi:hypothetical protein